ncbi:Conserved_hypothetical protein [Hexamita inflata]|uniref:Uncharacterized protein n=1 Tax=Hexamita inflata TaxID=28002 RepID=A0AA86UE03_9EUKA|nr:Conserved hypothetical protein [Hexamita inflata]CAI9928438.1 Conserved hypothetical protein [Hexamita inflata]CAI9954430.1 Conserved hypothetical protein [Hexamita inflata]CAI9954883.1 Conserved hypothetical protein [Hexamita inflata]CAI9961306.1 Conserved hypothetical protein [Hexamita inflata]
MTNSFNSPLTREFEKTQFSPQNFGSQPNVYCQPFTTPMPMKTPAIYQSDNYGQIMDAVEQIKNLKQEVEEKFNLIEDRIQNQPVSLSQNNQTVQYQPAQSMVRQEVSPRIVQLPSDVIIISPQQLEKLVEDKVKLKLKQYEDQLRNSQHLELRVKQLEDSLLNLGKSSVLFQPQNMTTQNLSNSVSYSLSERLEKVQQQIAGLGKK